MKYLFDANVFIEAKNRYYAFDICPGFWDWIDHVVAQGDAGSIIPVRDELRDGGDELADWIEARRHHPCFLPVDDDATQEVFADIAAFVQAESYKDPAKAKFLARADPWLIAKARVERATVVTHEVLAVDARARVPMPNICNRFGVRYVNTFDALRSLEASFTFSPQRKATRSDPF